MWTKLTTLAGTALGKTLIGASVAIAATSGAQLGGAIDVVPGADTSTSIETVEAALPSISSSTSESTSATDSSTTVPSTTAPSTTVPSTTVPSTTVPSTTVPSTTVPSTTAPSDPTVAPASPVVSTHPVLDAGSVTISVDGHDVVVIDVQANDGWNPEIENEPLEAGVNFRNGSDRVDFRAEIEDGQLRIRVRDRRTDDVTETVGSADDSPSSSVDDGPHGTDDSPSSSVDDRSDDRHDDDRHGRDDRDDDGRHGSDDDRSDDGRHGSDD